MENIHISNVIDAEERTSNTQYPLTPPDAGNNTNPVSHVVVYRANHWLIEAAKETATRTQPLLASVPVEQLVDLLAKAMDNFLTSPLDYDLLVTLTGIKRAQLEKDMEGMKQWVRNLLPFYLRHIHPERYCALSTEPALVVLPSNADVEVLYVLVQNLLARNATIVRPSSRGASSFLSHRFITAFNQAVRNYAPPEQQFLKSAFTLVNTDTNYLQTLAVNGWNYVLFGDDDTLDMMESTLTEHCKPRHIVKFGTGLSISIIYGDCDFHASIDKVFASVTYKAGIECDTTDVIYVEEKLYGDALAALQVRAEDYAVDRTLPANRHFIEHHAIQLRSKSLQYTEDGSIRASFLALHDFETTLEYPGPIASVRAFRDQEHLQSLIHRDLKDNGKRKNLVTSVYTGQDSTFTTTLPLLSTYLVKYNEPTHQFDVNKPHQGIFLLEALTDRMYL